MSKPALSYTALLPVRGRPTAFPMPSLEDARDACRAALRGKGQKFRTLRRTSTEEVYTTPNGRHAAVQILPA